MEYDIIITPSAKADIFEINVWFLEKSPELANNWLLGLNEKIVSLKEFPKRCPISPESEAFENVEVREILYGKKTQIYRILFSIRENKIYILRIRSTRQQSLLDEQS